MRHEDSLTAHLGTFAHGMQRLDPLPRCVEIHPTDLCNHRCAFCFHGGTGGQLRANRPVISLDRYRNLFEEMHALAVSELSISGGGEPTLDTRLPDLLEAAYEHGLSVRLVTHGALLEARLIEALMAARELRVSIDAAHPTTYATLRRVPESTHGRVLANLAELVKRKLESRADVEIGVTFTLGPGNFAEVGQFCKQMLALGVDAVVIKNDVYATPSSSRSWHDAAIGLMGDGGDSRISIREPLRLTSPAGRCFAPYFKIAVNPYGDVFSCCLGSQPGETDGHALGTLREHSLREIWTLSRPLRTWMATCGAGCTHCNHTDIRLNQAVNAAMVSTTSDVGILAGYRR